METMYLYTTRESRGMRWFVGMNDDQTGSLRLHSLPIDQELEEGVYVEVPTEGYELTPAQQIKAKEKLVELGLSEYETEETLEATDNDIVVLVDIDDSDSYFVCDLEGDLMEGLSKLKAQQEAIRIANERGSNAWLEIAPFQYILLSRTSIRSAVTLHRDYNLDKIAEKFRNRRKLIQATIL